MYWDHGMGVHRYFVYRNNSAFFPWVVFLCEVFCKTPLSTKLLDSVAKEHIHKIWDLREKSAPLLFSHNFFFFFDRVCGTRSETSTLI